MAKKKRRGRSGFRRIVTLLFASVIVLYCVADSIEAKSGIDLGLPEIPQISAGVFEAISKLVNPGREAVPVSLPKDAQLQVHFIDVGQSEAILVRSGSYSALIDAGENDQGSKVVSYIASLGIKSLDVVIATHPHSDHIGGMDDVIRAFDVGTIIFPDIADEVMSTTKTYTDLLMAIAQKGYKITLASPGDVYSLGEANLYILGPVKHYDDLNNYSVVSKLVLGEVSFLFTGDIEKKAEDDIVLSGQNISANVLSSPHHGSHTSSSDDFLRKVLPEYVVISCGIDNSYGHPRRETIEAYNAFGIEIYRTDLDGTVVVSTDGKDIEVITKK